MPEKLRRIPDPQQRSLIKKKIFVFLVSIFIVTVVSLGIYKNNLKKTPIENLSEKTSNSMAAIMCYATDCFSLNDKGITLQRSPRSNGNLVFVINSNKEPVSVGSKAIEQNSLAELLFLRKQIYKDAQIQLVSAEFSNAEATDFDLKTNESWTLKISVKNNANATIEILKRILQELGPSRHDLEYIDLRLPTRAYYKTMSNR